MRTFDAKNLNRIANLPSVRPHLGGENLIDLKPILANPRNYAFVNDLGGFVCINTFGATYEVHTIFDPQRRGTEEIVALMFQAERFMFSNTDCIEITSKVPEGNRGADRLANTFCFSDVGKQTNWDKGRSATLKRKTLEDWAKNSPETYVAGRNFHDTLEAAKRQAGSAIVPHAEDAMHDMLVGAAVLMVKGGQVRKGIGFYNYWATFAGYAQITLLSDLPPVVDIHDAVIGIEAGNLEVYLCR